MGGRTETGDVLRDTPARVAGSDAERRAANELARRLRRPGRDVDVQSFFFGPRYGLALACTAIAAIVGSVVAVSSPAPGAAVVGVATVLTLLDVGGLAMPVRRIFGRRASQNVERSEPAERPGTLVIAAGCDSPRDSPALRLATRLLRAPWLAMVLAMAALLVCCAVRLAGLDSSALTIVQFIPTVVLILLVPALVDIELSRAGPDPAGAAAAATAIALADDLDGGLDHFRVRVVLTGANQPFALGMRRWLRRNRKDLGRETTAVVVIGPCGDGSLQVTRREGPLLAYRSHRDLTRLAREVGEDGGEEVELVTSREVTNASVALARRLPAITLSTGGAAQPDAEALDRLRAFARELAERLDAEIGPALER